MHGQSSSRTTDRLSDLVGEETGLPLVICPRCKLARVIERRSTVYTKTWEEELQELESSQDRVIEESIA